MRSVTCVSCGLVGWADGGACKRCGKPLSEVNRQTPRGAQQQQDYNAGYKYNAGQDYNAGHDYNAGYNYAHTPDYSDANAKKRKGHAVASLVIGVLGLFTFGILLIGSIVGTVLGVVAMKKQSSAPAVYGGRGLAIAGVVMNILALVMIVPLGIVAAIAIPNLLAAARAANEASAISTMRVIMAAESTYQATAGGGTFGTLNQLAAAGLVDGKLSSGTKNGYAFTVTSNANGYEARATPLTHSSGNRSFFITTDDDGDIHVGLNGQPANANDPTLDSLYGSQPRRIVSRHDFQSPATAPAY
jgi:type II secretory pathway pseudopilin PulG